MSDELNSKTKPTNFIDKGALERHILDRRETFRIAKSTARDANYRSLAECAEIFDVISKDTDLFKEFVNMALWDYQAPKPTDKDKSDLLRFVLRAMEGSGSAAEKRVSKQLIAINGLLHLGVAPSDFVDEFKRRGGFAAVVNSFAKKADTKGLDHGKPRTVTLPKGMPQNCDAVLCIIEEDKAIGQTIGKPRLTILGPVPTGILHNDIMGRLSTRPSSTSSAGGGAHTKSESMARSPVVPNSQL